MKGKIYKKGLAVLLGLTLAANLPVTSPLSIHMLDSYAYTGAATVKASSLNVRSDAGTGYSAVARLAAGASIQITGEKKGTDGKTWYRIQYTGSNGQAGTGYVSAAYIRLPVSYSTDASFESYLTSQGFPESYKDGLRQLHAQYPNWVFRAKNTGIDWNTAIENESVLGRNLVATGSISSWKSVESGAYNWDNSTIWIPETFWTIPMYSSSFPMNMMEAHRQKRALQEWFPAPSFPEQQTPPEQGEVLLPAVLLHQEAAALPAVLPVLFHRRDREEETVQQVIQIMDLVWQEAALPAAVLLVRAALHPAAMM